MTYAFHTTDKLCFILDLMNGKISSVRKWISIGCVGGDLHYHLSQHGVFSEKEVKFYAAEIILGLEHMHLRSIVYRDLKVRDLSSSLLSLHACLRSRRIFSWMNTGMFASPIWVSPVIFPRRSLMPVSEPTGTWLRKCSPKAWPMIPVPIGSHLDV